MQLIKGKGAHVVPARREYFLTLVRPNGERMTWYDGCVYHTDKQAKTAAKRFNTYRKQGKIIVEFVDRPESIGYELGTIQF